MSQSKAVKALEDASADLARHLDALKKVAPPRRMDEGDLADARIAIRDAIDRVRHAIRVYESR